MPAITANARRSGQAHAHRASRCCRYTTLALSNKHFAASDLDAADQRPPPTRAGLGSKPVGNFLCPWKAATSPKNIHHSRWRKGREKKQGGDMVRVDQWHYARRVTGSFLSFHFLYRFTFNFSLRGFFFWCDRGFTLPAKCKYACNATSNTCIRIASRTAGFLVRIASGAAEKRWELCRTGGHGSQKDRSHDAVELERRWRMERDSDATSTRLASRRGRSRV